MRIIHHVGLVAATAVLMQCTTPDQMMRESVTIYGDTALITCVNQQEIVGELLCYRNADLWLLDTAGKIRVVEFQSIASIEVNGTVISAYFWPTMAAIALPWTLAAVTSTAYGADTEHVLGRVGFGLGLTVIPLITNAIGTTDPEYSGHDFRMFPTTRQFFRYQWPIAESVRQQLLSQHKQTNPLPFCDGPGTPLLPHRP